MSFGFVKREFIHEFIYFRVRFAWHVSGERLDRLGAAERFGAATRFLNTREQPDAGVVV